MLVGLTILVSHQINGQTFSSPPAEEGEMTVWNITPEDYQYAQGHYQNWAVVTDGNGFIYAANGSGVMEYDGISWRLILSPDLHAVRTLTVDHNNVKWVGADRELGYLAADSMGFLQYISLKDKIPPSDPLVANVWSVFAQGDRVLFMAANTIYCWENDQFRIIPSPGEIHREFQVNGEIYFRVKGQGFYKLEGDSLQLIPGGDAYKDISILAAMPYDGNGLLFASRDLGLLVYQDGVTRVVNSNLKDYFQEHILYKGLMLPDSTYAFATLRGGVIISDKQGNVLREINEKSGVQNNQVHGIVVDSELGLWLALQTGLSRVQSFLPFTFFDERLGLRGTITGIVRHQGTLYISTHEGLFTLIKPPTGPARFERNEQINTGCFSIIPAGDVLLLATRDGVFQISKSVISQINQLPGSQMLYRSLTDSNRVYVGHLNGLSTLYFKDDQWLDEKTVDQVEEHIMSISETAEGDIWLGTSLQEVIRLEFPKVDIDGGKDFDGLTVHHFINSHGLPDGYTSPYIVDGEILVSTNRSNGPLFKYDGQKTAFVKVTDFGKKFDIDSLLLFPVAHQEETGDLLLESLPHKGQVYRFSASKDGAGGYSVVRVYDETYRTFLERNAILWEYKHHLWSGGEAAASYDLKANFELKGLFKTNIRRVIVGQDSSIYGGEKATTLAPPLKYAHSGLRFEYSAPDYSSQGTTKYQYFLVGFDDDWSDWTDETRKDYTNLPEGSYQFMARAKNIYGRVSTADSYNFEILAPWYRTIWAYGAYAILATLFIYMVVQWRSAQLKRDKRTLEALVDQKTSEIKMQAQKLRELDQAKSHFFANISHEFRTPLALILGPLKDKLNQNLTTEERKDVSVMHRSAERLQRLINQLLDLSKLESNRLKLNLEPLNIGFFLKAILSSFSSHAEQRQITYLLQVPQEQIWGQFDRDKLEKIVYNLVSNAFKFTPNGGDISVVAICGSKELSIIVEDNGCGIPKENLPQIFNRFYQADDSNTRNHEGTGIGLALTKELVELSNGSIEVSSWQGKGTIFKVLLPYQPVAEPAFQGSPIMTTPVDVGTAFIPPAFTPEMGYGEKPMVLLVEDHHELRGYIKSHLSDYTILEAADGEAGLQTALKQVPDLIISDVMMPKMDGVCLVQALKSDQKTSHIPVILLTAKADIASKLEGLHTGADDYLTKPFNGQELQVRCQNLIEQRRLLRERFSNTMVLKPKEIAITSVDETFLTRVMEILEQHMDNSDFSVEIFQREIGMSRMQLHRKLKALTNYSTTEFIRIQRLQRAAQMLGDSDLPVSDICYQVGFNNKSYFSKCFKEQFGITPSAYANQAHKTPND